MAVKSKIITQVEDGQREVQGKLLYPPYQTYFHSAQVAHSKQKLLSSLNQVGYDVSQLQDKGAAEILSACEDKLKKSYSIKVVGMCNGELGVISKRVEMNKLKGLKAKSNTNSPPNPSFFVSQQPYQVHNDLKCRMKSFKTIKRVKDPEEEEFKKRLLNWQAQQFEKIKGKTQDDDESTEIQPEMQKSKKGMLPHVKLQKIKKVDSPKNTLIEKNGDVTEVNAIFSNAQPKLSYSRILEKFCAEQPQNSPMRNQLVVTNLHKKAPEPPKLGGVIIELDEEHENYQSDKKATEEIGMKQISSFSIPLSDQDLLQRRLKKIQDKINSEQDNLF